MDATTKDVIKDVPIHDVSFVGTSTEDSKVYTYIYIYIVLYCIVLYCIMWYCVEFIIHSILYIRHK